MNASNGGKNVLLKQRMVQIIAINNIQTERYEIG